MKMKWFQVERLVGVFDKKTDRYIRTYKLSPFNLKEVQKIFGQEPGNLMYYCYPITEREAPYFRKKYGLRFHFKKHEYFLECVRRK